MYEIPLGSTSPLPVKLVDSTDRVTEETGITAPTVHYLKSGGTATSVSPTWTEASASGLPGVYLLTPTAAMVDTAGPLIITVTKAGCAPASIVCDVKAARFATGGSVVASNMVAEAPALTPVLDAIAAAQEVITTAIAEKPVTPATDLTGLDSKLDAIAASIPQGESLPAGWLVLTHETPGMEPVDDAGVLVEALSGETLINSAVSYEIVTPGGIVNGYRVPLPAGTYTIRFHRVGYVYPERTVTL